MHCSYKYTVNICMLTRPRLTHLVQCAESWRPLLWYYWCQVNGTWITSPIIAQPNSVLLIQIYCEHMCVLTSPRLTHLVQGCSQQGICMERFELAQEKPNFVGEGGKGVVVGYSLPMFWLPCLSEPQLQVNYMIIQFGRYIHRQGFTCMDIVEPNKIFF